MVRDEPTRARRTAKFGGPLSTQSGVVDGQRQAFQEPRSRPCGQPIEQQWRKLRQQHFRDPVRQSNVPSVRDFSDVGQQRRDDQIVIFTGRSCQLLSYSTRVRLIMTWKSAKRSRLFWCERCVDEGNTLRGWRHEESRERLPNAMKKRHVEGTATSVACDRADRRAACTWRWRLFRQIH